MLARGSEGDTEDGSKLVCLVPDFGRLLCLRSTQLCSDMLSFVIVMIVCD